MPQYHALTPDSAAIFANEHSALFGEHSQLQSTAFGQSHFNLVFRVKNQFGTSLIVKQARPVPHAAGEEWPLPLDRARIEAEVLQRQHRIVPDHVVEVLHFDPTLSTLLLEDLAAYELLSKALRNGKQLPQLASHMAHYLAQCSFFSSDFQLDGPSKKAAQSRFSNAELCLITEELVFSDPYCHHERNHFSRELLPMLRDMWHDEALLAEVAWLKLRFRSAPQALIHGDLNTASVFVTHDSTKVIDAEFGCYGPIGFDVGTFIAHLILHYLACPALQREQNPVQHQGYLFSQIRTLWQLFADEFQRLAQQECRHPSWQNEKFIHAYISQILVDTVGFIGTELIRRIVGFYHVEDIDKITQLPQQKLQIEQAVLKFGQQCILRHRQITHIDQVLAWLSDINA